MRRGAACYGCGVVLMTGVGWLIASQTFLNTATAMESGGIIVGTVQGQDLRRVDQAMVQVRDQEGKVEDRFEQAQQELRKAGLAR